MDTVQATKHGACPSRSSRTCGWNVRRITRGVPAVSSEARRQLELKSVPPLMQLMKYQLWCFTAATTAYWLVAGQIKKRPRRLWICRTAALSFGILSLLFLVSMLLPHPVSIWIPLTLMSTVPILYKHALCFTEDQTLHTYTSRLGERTKLHHSSVSFAGAVGGLCLAAAASWKIISSEFILRFSGIR